MVQDQGKRVTQRGVNTSIERFAKRLESLRSVHDSDIVFHLTGDVEGKFCLRARGGAVEAAEVTELEPMAPTIAVIGDARAVSDILDGKADARKEFFAGKFRVQGDLYYLSELALEAGLIDVDWAYGDPRVRARGQRLRQWQGNRPLHQRSRLRF